MVTVFDDTDALEITNKNLFIASSLEDIKDGDPMFYNVEETKYPPNTSHHAVQPMFVHEINLVEGFLRDLETVEIKDLSDITNMLEFDFKNRNFKINIQSNYTASYNMGIGDQNYYFGFDTYKEPRTNTESNPWRIWMNENPDDPKTKLYYGVKQGKKFHFYHPFFPIKTDSKMTVKNIKR